MIKAHTSPWYWLKLRKEFSVKTTFLTILMLAFSVIMTSGCAPIISSDEYNIDYAIEDNYIQNDPIYQSNNEDDLPHDNELAFISLLNEVGLSWSLSEQHRHHFRFPDHNQIYFISCPMNLITCIVSIRDYDGDGITVEERYVRLNFFVSRVPTEEEFSRLQQYGILTKDEWLQFWELSGKILNEGDSVESIALRAQEYLDDFLYGDKSDNQITFMQGNTGDIDYYFGVSWQIGLRLHGIMTIELIVGLCDVRREHRRSIGLSPSP